MVAERYPARHEVAATDASVAGVLDHAAAAGAGAEIPTAATVAANAASFDRNISPTPDSNCHTEAQPRAWCDTLPRHER